MGAAWFFYQCHFGLFETTVSLFIVAYGAGAHQIVPGIISPQTLGHQMIDGKRPLVSAAVLANITVPPEDVLLGNLDLYAGFAYKIAQPDDAGQ